MRGVRGDGAAARRGPALRRRRLLPRRRRTRPAGPVEALLWLRTTPPRIDELGRALATASSVRYAAELAGDSSFLVDVTAPDKAALRDLVTTSPWWSSVNSLEVSVVVESLKRSAVLSSRLRGAGTPDDVG